MTVHVKGVHHIGVVVADLGAASALLERLFGLDVVARIDRPDLEAVFYACGDVQIELIELHDEEARASRLGDSTARIDHIALNVADLQEALSALTVLAVGLGPPYVAAGMPVAWAEPETTGGIRYQLVESGGRRERS